MSGYKISEHFAQRMKSTILRVEGMPLSTGDGTIPVRFDERPSIVGDSIQRAKFKGSWLVGEAKTVTLVTDTSTASTVSVTNYCAPIITSSADEELTVIFSSVQGTATALEIQGSTATCVLSVGGVNLTTIQGYSSSVIQVLGHAANGCLRWYGISTCTSE